MSETLESIAASGGHQVLTVTTTPSFALRWLVPRLNTLRGPAEGGFEVHLRPTLRMLDVAHGEVDVAIRCGIPPWPGLKAELVMPAHMTPVCSPHLLAGHKLPLAPSDLLNFTLLHADVGNIPIGNEWRTWLHAAGLSKRASLPGLSFQDPALSFQAAISGAGFAIGYVELLQAEFAAGTLIRPFELEVRHIFSYYLAYPPLRENEPAIADFRRWIFDQVAMDQQRPQRKIGAKGRQQAHQSEHRSVKAQGMRAHRGNPRRPSMTY
jgi:LysR family glycine cleavage system transcriptional activator